MAETLTEAPPPAKPRRAPWTREEAREMGARGNRIRWHSDPRPPPTAAASPQPAQLIAQSEPYLADRLERVRKQLDRLDLAILAEVSRSKPDGQRLNWLAAAQERLAEQERLLAGRPLPGSRRPAPERRRQYATASPQLNPVPARPPDTPPRPGVMVDLPPGQEGAPSHGAEVDGGSL